MLGARTNCHCSHFFEPVFKGISRPEDSLKRTSIFSHTSKQLTATWTLHIKLNYGHFQGSFRRTVQIDRRRCMREMKSSKIGCVHVVRFDDVIISDGSANNTSSIWIHKLDILISERFHMIQTLSPLLDREGFDPLARFFSFFMRTGQEIVLDGSHSHTDRLHTCPPPSVRNYWLLKRSWCHMDVTYCKKQNELKPDSNCAVRHC